MNHSFDLQTTRILTKKQQKDITDLVSLCCIHDQIHLSCPTDDDNTAYFLLYDNEELCAVLSLTFFSDSEKTDDTGYAECTAFTLPFHRKQGCFSRLLSAVLDEFDEYDILFTVSANCKDTMAVLRALEAEFQSDEHQMEWHLENSASILSLDDSESASARRPLPTLSLLPGYRSDSAFSSETGASISDFDGTVSWILTCPDVPDSGIFGTCQTSRFSEDCVCLHHVEICPDFRGQGYGTRLMSLLLSSLVRAGIRRVILQVSGNNQPAISLYKKTGFHITETLSCYLY